jgi:hypothetical protein
VLPLESSGSARAIAGKMNMSTANDKRSRESLPFNLVHIFSSPLVHIFSSPFLLSGLANLLVKSI